MTKVDENIKSAQNLLSGIVERCHELEEENKKLNIIIENTKIEQKSDREHIEELEEENQKLKEENKKLKYVIDSVMEKAGIEYIRLADGDVFTNPKNKLQISDTIQVDILNHKQ